MAGVTLDCRDVTIIGGGPAGSVAAIMLARRGWDVTLIEQHRFPRDKVCGECLSVLGIEVLTRLGIESSLRDLGPAILKRAALIAPSGATAEFALPRSMWGISRRAMDHLLMEQARLAGAKVLQPARIESIDPVNVSLTVRDLVTNETKVLRPGRIIVADGKASLAVTKPAPTGDFGIKAHFTGVADSAETISLFGVNGHYLGLAPIEGGRWNVAMSVPAARIAAVQGNLDTLFAMLLTENVGLESRFHGAKRTGEWLASPLPRFPVAVRWPSRIIPIGNAAAALEPIGGEGMGLAMRSAELAAIGLCASLTISDVSREFRRLWSLRRTVCRGVSQLLSRSAIADPMIDFAQGNDQIGRLVMRWMGKA